MVMNCGNNNVFSQNKIVRDTKIKLKKRTHILRLVKF